MDDGCGGFGPRDWGCYCEQPQPPYKSNLGLQLMSIAGAERGAKGLLGYGAFLQRDCGSGGVMPHPSIPVDFARENWLQQRDKFAHMLPLHQPNYALIPDNHVSVQMVPQQQQQQQQQKQHLDLQKDENQMVLIGENGERKDPSPKKRPAGRTGKAPKPKKPKKASAPKEGAANGTASRGKPARKSLEMVINGVDLDISTLPAPVCTCTGTPQQCYRWGVGGWQSACCTTGISMYPLPMSQKRRGARIAGRKMSQGAFKKVLEKLISEGYNLSDPIDLRPYWAKHGTNKFVTIR